MWLKQSQVAHYLVSLGLVNPRAVLEEDLIVTDVSRRNTVFLVASSGEPTYVIKQAGRDGANTLAHEAAVTRALAGVTSLAGAVPELAHYDPGAVRLVLRSPANAEPLSVHDRVGRLTPRALGRSLAALHGASLDLDSSLSQDERLWALALVEPSPGQLRDLSAAALDVLDRIHANRDLCDRLRWVREDAVEDAFVHGDLRWDNCLTFSTAGSRRRTRVLLIDWELAGRGEAAADVGAVLGEYVRAFVDSIPKFEDSDVTRFAHHASLPVERLHPAMRALWDGYGRASTRPLAPARVLEHAAVRLLQSAIEYAQGFVRPTGDAVALVQVAERMLLFPALAWGRMFGLPA